MNQKTGTQKLQIPDEAAWEHHPEDLDWACARKVFFGKSLEQAMPLFLENPIERTDELRFMPRLPFQYYIRAYAAFLLSPQLQHCDEPFSAASCFLGLLEDKLKERGGYLTPSLLHELLPAAEFVACNQQQLEADEDIFGNFAQQLQRIKALAGV